MQAQVEIRCTKCTRLLFKMEPGALGGVLSIKCGRCKSINVLRPIKSPLPKRPEREDKEALCGCSSPQQT